MLYNQRLCIVPDDFEIGCKVFVVGEHMFVYTVMDILRDKDDPTQVMDVLVNSKKRFPLSRLILRRGTQTYNEAIKDPSNRIIVAIGQCDKCSGLFPDNCSYYTPNGELSMLCKGCFNKKKNNDS